MKTMQDIFFWIPLKLFYQTAKCESGALDGSIVMQCQKIGVRASDGVRPQKYMGKALEKAGEPKKNHFKTLFKLL